MALECFNVHHRLLALRAKKMVPFPRSYIPECSSICSLHSFPSTRFTPSWWPQRTLVNPFLKPVSTLIITVQTPMGWTLQSIPWRSHQRLHSHHATARHCGWTVSTFNPTFKWIPFYLSAEFWSPHPHASVTKKGCGKLQKLYGAGIYGALPWLGVEWRMGISSKSSLKFELWWLRAASKTHNVLYLLSLLSLLSIGGITKPPGHNLFKTFYFVWGYSQLTKKVVIFSGEQWGDSAMYRCIHSFPQTLLPSRLLRNMEQSSLGSTGGPF